MYAITPSLKKRGRATMEEGSGKGHVSLLSKFRCVKQLHTNHRDLALVFGHFALNVQPNRAHSTWKTHHEPMSQ